MTFQLQLILNFFLLKAAVKETDFDSSSNSDESLSDIQNLESYEVMFISLINFPMISKDVG